MEKGVARNPYSHKNRRFWSRYPSLKTTMVEVSRPGKDPGPEQAQQAPQQEKPKPSQQVVPQLQSPQQSPKREKQGYEKTWPQNENRRSARHLRDRFQYVIPMVLDRLCPKRGYKYYMGQIDKTLEAEKQLQHYQEKLNRINSETYKEFGLPAPLVEQPSERHRMQYHKLVSSFQEIKRQLSNPGAENRSEFNTLTAALEAIGTILLNPCILDYTEERYEAREQSLIPRLSTKLFTTPWTYERILHLSWRSGEDGVEVRKNEVDNILLSTEKVEDPGKDPTDNKHEDEEGEPEK